MLIKKDLTKIDITHFTLKTIKRSDLIKYPDDINEAFNTDFSFGGFLEKRNFYKSSNKIVHTGLDIFIKKGEKIISPFSGYVSDILYIGPEKYQIGSGTGFQIIIWHTFDEIKSILGEAKSKKIFGKSKYLKIIYIHLSSKFDFKKKNKIIIRKKDVLFKSFEVNKRIDKNENIGVVANSFVNGGWSPHVHVECSLENEISNVGNDFNGGALGIINETQLKPNIKNKLVDPKLIFGFDKLKPRKQVMSLDNIDKTKSLISIKNLNVDYLKKQKVIKDFSLEINENELISILGPSGCGKTTLLNAISGFIKYKGKINIRNINNVSDIGYVFQDNDIYDSLSVFKNIYIGAFNNKKYYITTYINIWKNTSISKSDKQEVENIKSMFQLFLLKDITAKTFYQRFNKFKKHFNKNYQKIFFKKNLKKEIIDILAKLKISNLENKKPSELSGGEKQRVAIAKAIIKKSVILIMDEPLASLDAKIRNETREWIKNIQIDFGITMLFVTHDQSEAMLISDKIILMKEGSLVQYGNPKELYNNPVNEFAAKFIGWPEINLVRETKNKKYFVRPNLIKITKTTDKNFWLITKKELLGKEYIYYIKKKDENLIITSENDFEVNTKVKVKWESKHEKVF